MIIIPPTIEIKIIYIYIDIVVKKNISNKFIIVYNTKIKISINGWIKFIRIDEIIMIIIERIVIIIKVFNKNEVVII